MLNVELHNHLGGATDPHLLWSIARQGGIKLKYKDYASFIESVDFTKIAAKKSTLPPLERLWELYKTIEKIQSSAHAVEICIKEALSKAYRDCHVKIHEMRFDPMARNKGGELDLDFMIQSAIWGMQKAIYEYPDLRAGLILCLHRSHSFEENQIIFQKAKRFWRNGVIGIDVAGPYHKAFDIKQYEGLFREAKDSGLGTTIHTAETDYYEDMRDVVTLLKPDRIGHGIYLTKYPRLIETILENKVTLEICPTSNMINSVMNADDLVKTLRYLLNNEVNFTINTDGQEIYQTNIVKEIQWVRENVDDEAAQWAQGCALLGTFL